MDVCRMQSLCNFCRRTAGLCAALVATNEPRARRARRIRTGRRTKELQLGHDLLHPERFARSDACQDGRPAIAAGRRVTDDLAHRRHLVVVYAPAATLSIEGIGEQ